MATHLVDCIFFLGSAGAEVWAALMVFHILLIRDLRHHVEREIDSLWAEARLWWPKLLVIMKDHRGLRHRLGDFGLDHRTILRADTHKNSFIRLIAAIKAHKIVSQHGRVSEAINDQILSPLEWQLKFEPIAERIEELEREKPDASSAFYLGLLAVTFNLITLTSACLPIADGIFQGLLLSLMLLGNLVFIAVFYRKVRRALYHATVAAQHDSIAKHMREVTRGVAMTRLSGPNDQAPGRARSKTVA